MKKAICSVVLFAVVTSAFAGRPLATDDAGVIDPGKVELESYYHRQTRNDASALSGLHTRLGAGVGLGTELGIDVDWLRQYDEHFQSHKSSGEYALEGKTAIKELTDDVYGIAMAYGVDRMRAVGDRFRYDNAYLYGVLTVPVDKWLLHANLGWQRSRLAAVTSTTWNLAAERIGVIGPIDLAAETFGNDHDPAWVQVSARWVVKEDRFFLDTSYGVQMGGVRAKLLTVGGKLAF
jgi:hypothetical protein